MQLRDDHARMITPNGADRLVPFSQIRDWQRRGIAARLGYKFATQAGADSYGSWLQEKLATEAERREAPPVVSRDPGMAQAGVGVGIGSGAALGRTSGGAATVPPGPASGTGQILETGRTTQGAALAVDPKDRTAPAGASAPPVGPRPASPAADMKPREALDSGK